MSAYPDGFRMPAPRGYCFACLTEADDLIDGNCESCHERMERRLAADLDETDTETPMDA